MEIIKSPELARLRRALAEHDRGRGKRYDPELRERVARWTRERTAAGARTTAVAAELGMRIETVRSWMQPASSAVTRLLPVQIIDDPPPAQTLTLRSPSGLRIEGLSLADAVAILRALG